MFIRSSVVLSLAGFVALGVSPLARAHPDATEAPGHPAAAPDPVSIVVSIPPLKGLASELCKDLNVSVQTLIPVGVSEHGYEIPAAKFRALAKADVIVYIGRGLEPAITKYMKDHAARPNTERLEFGALLTDDAAEPGAEAAGKDRAPVKPEHKPDHGHDHTHDHDHGHAGHDHDHDHSHAADPHVWLDPANVKLLVPALRQSVQRVLSSRGEYSAEAKEFLDRAEASLLERIDGIDAAYAATLKAAASRTIVVAHDAYGLLACRYDLKVVAIAGLHASEPTMKDVKRAIDAIKEQNARVVFVEPQLSRRAGENVAKVTGAKILVLDPVGGDDWFATMNKNLDALASGLGVERATGK